MIRQCASCGAEIQWADTERGKRLPIDAVPTKDGNITIMTIGDGRRIAHVHGKPEEIEPTLKRYTSHFVTCPGAGQHRKPR